MTQVNNKPLLNQRQTLFCDFIVAGNTATKAAQLAGYSHNAADVHASRLLTNARILAKIQELQAKITERMVSDKVMTELEAHERLSDIARAELVDFLDHDKPKLDRDVPHHAAAGEYYHRTRYDKDGNEVVTKGIKLHNPVTAIAKLAELKGWLKTLPQGFNDNRTIIINVTSKEAEQLIGQVGSRTKQVTKSTRIKEEAD